MIDIHGAFNGLMGYSDDEPIEPMLLEMIKAMHKAGKKWQDEHVADDDFVIEATRNENGELTVKVTPKGVI